MKIFSVVNNLWIQFLLLLQYPYHKYVFKEWHVSSQIQTPLQLTPRYISVGKHVYIHYNARIEAVTVYAGVRYNPEILISEGVTIQQNLHLTCAKKVTIGENTAIVSNVTITDIIHPYTAEDKHLIHHQLIIKPVKIGKYCAIYNNVVINAGVTIGNHAIIGANSVVTKDIPDYCVAVGSPARIIKRYNFETKQWQKTDKQGNFI